MHATKTAATTLSGNDPLDAGMGRDIVAACNTVEGCAYQLSLTVSKLGRMCALAPERSVAHEVKAQLHEHRSELDGKIRQILEVVKRIGGVSPACRRGARAERDQPSEGNRERPPRLERAAFVTWPL